MCSRSPPRKPRRCRLSLRCLSSCHFAGDPAGVAPLPPPPPHRRSPPLPAPHACYFHHFYAFAPLPCACSSYISELNFPSVLSTRLPAGVFLLQCRRGGSGLFTLLNFFLFTDTPAFRAAASLGFRSGGGSGAA